MTQEQSAAALVGVGTSSSGNVQARVRGGDLVDLDVRPEWRETVPPPELEQELREAINAALAAYTQEFVKVAREVQAEPAPHLSRDLRDIAAEATIPGMASALEEMARVVDTIEEAEVLPAAPIPPAPPVVVDLPSGGVTARIDNGMLTQLSLNDLWLASVPEKIFVASVCEAVTQAVWAYLTERLEAQVSATEGGAGLVSALYECQAYATSSLSMHLARSDDAL